MNTKNLLLAASAFAAITLTSCFKDGVDPVTGKNSVLQIESIAFQNLTGNTATQLVGSARFDFYIANGSNGEITDTTTLTDSFYVSNPAGYTQTYDLNTPDKTKKNEVQHIFSDQRRRKRAVIITVQQATANWKRYIKR